MPQGLKGFQKGINNPSIINGAWNKGRKTPKNTIDKLRKSHIGYVMPQSQKEKIRKKLRGKPKPLRFKEKVSGKNHHNWKGGKSFQLYGFEWTDLLKHSIRTRDCFVCRICKKDGHIVHHIDYNKFNNNPENLITLCRSCHQKTNFRREHWISYFKKYE